MNDEKNKKLSDSERQPSTTELHRVEPGQVTSQRTDDEQDKTTSDNEQAPRAKEAAGSDGGVLLRDRPPRPGTIELKGPPGMAVSVGGDEWCTKIVLHLLANDEGACTP
jgi:hypothetical protein